MSMLPITEAIIRHKSNTSSYKGGEDYFRRRAVIDLKKRGNTIKAKIEGNKIDSHKVSINFDAAGVTSTNCSCADNYDGWCKHIVATLLTCLRLWEIIEECPTIEQLLNRLDHQQTQRLVQELVQSTPELIEDVDYLVNFIKLPTPPAKSPSPRRTIDVASIRSQVRQILKDGIEEMENGCDDDPFSEELVTIIEEAQEFIENGDGNNAIAILEAITTTYVKGWDELTNYDGESYSIAEPLERAWTEAILSVDRNVTEATDLQTLLESWQDEIDIDFAMSLEALRQGWNYEPLQQVMRGDSTQLYSDTRPDCASDLTLIRLNYLQRQERYTEYLNLAFAEGMTQQYLTQLAALGRVSEVMSVAKTQMDTAAAAFALAKILREDGYLSEALEISQTGLSLPDCMYEFASWTSDLAQGLGNISTALESSIVAFEIRPSFRDYTNVEQLAGEIWSEVKQDLLQVLRDSKGWHADDAKVDIFLHEGLIDDAIQIVKGDTYYRSESLHRVMEAAIPHRPDWVINSAKTRAEAIMDNGKADRYSEAVKWLKKVQAAYFQLKQQAEWSAYRSNLEQAHGRKRKLMELFQELNKA